MNKRFFLAWLVVFIAWFIGSFIVHGVLLHADYAQLSNLFRKERRGTSWNWTFALHLACPSLRAEATRLQRSKKPMAVPASSAKKPGDRRVFFNRFGSLSSDVSDPDLFKPGRSGGQARSASPPVWNANELHSMARIRAQFRAHCASQAHGDYGACGKGDLFAAEYMGCSRRLCVLAHGFG